MNAGSKPEKRLDINSEIIAAADDLLSAALFFYLV
jgi:hypothetical protein